MQQASLQGARLKAHLDVTDCRVQGAAPVDQPVLSVDQALLVQPHKSFLHRRHQVIVHGESQAIPVYTDAHAPHLAEDLATVRLHPGKDLLQERLSACMYAKCGLPKTAH